jgi:hypothetical protein
MPGSRIITLLIALLCAFLNVACGAAAGPAAATDMPGAAWRPQSDLSWQIQYAGLPIDQSVNVQVYDIDLFTTDADVIAALRARGRNVVCYFSAGSYEPYRPDSDQFPAAVRGKPIEGFDDEQWLDIRQLDLLGPIMGARLDRARQQGCDGVDPDNVDGFANRTGFPLTARDQLAYNRWLADAAHQRGMAVFLKNDGDQVPDLAESFDGAVVEQCFEYEECDQYLPFTRAGKPVFEIEYNVAPETFCGQATELGFNSLYKHLALDAFRITCR